MTRLELGNSKPWSSISRDEAKTPLKRKSRLISFRINDPSMFAENIVFTTCTSAHVRQSVHESI